MSVKYSPWSVCRTPCKSSPPTHPKIRPDHLKESHVWCALWTVCVWLCGSCGSLVVQALNELHTYFGAPPADSFALPQGVCVCVFDSMCVCALESLPLPIPNLTLGLDEEHFGRWVYLVEVDVTVGNFLVQRLILQVKASGLLIESAPPWVCRRLLGLHRRLQYRRRQEGPCCEAQ